MTITHHPSEESLLRYAAGTLSAGPRLVLNAHLEHCALCRSKIGEFEAIGGAMLDEGGETALSPSALSEALTRIGATADVPRARAARDAAPIELGGVRLPEALRGCDVGRWRWIGPGMHMSRVRVPDDKDANVILLRIGPGKRLLEHSHKGTEFTYVVRGSFSDADGRYRPGDLTEADAAIQHQPVVDPDGECVCLAALDGGGMRPKSFIGRMIQPLFGI